jgi:hypothetical protein
VQKVRPPRLPPEQLSSGVRPSDVQVSLGADGHKV